MNLCCFNTMANTFATSYLYPASQYADVLYAMLQNNIVENKWNWFDICSLYNKLTLYPDNLWNKIIYLCCYLLCALVAMYYNIFRLKQKIKAKGNNTWNQFISGQYGIFGSLGLCHGIPHWTGMISNFSQLYKQYGKWGIWIIMELHHHAPCSFVPLPFAWLNN